MIGNGVACVAIADWDGALDRVQLKAALSGPEVARSRAAESTLAAGVEET